MTHKSHPHIIRLVIIALLIILMISCEFLEESDTPVAETSEISTNEIEAVTDQSGPTEEIFQPAFGLDENLSAEEIIDSGFRPENNGFSFENYGSGAVDLTPVEMQRLFGDQVCASLAGGECTLTPAAHQWMRNVNSAMANGHCEGMAVLSLLMHYGLVDPQDFGGEHASQLDINNELLQREIAYWFTTQSTSPASQYKIFESPSAVVNMLIETFNQGMDPEELWSVGLYKPDYSGGHAITPIGVADLGAGLYNILVYDNNYPNQVRYIQVDSNAETWQYEASINPQVEPDLYEGDASTQTLELAAISPRLEIQQCDFCDTAASAAGGMKIAAPTQEFYEIWLEGEANLIIVDESDRRIGFVDGVFTNEIPGATTQNYRFGVEVWEVDYEPVYRVPIGPDYEIIVDGSQMQTAGNSNVSLIGPGYFLAVDEIWLEPGEQDSIGIYIDGSRQQLTYMTDYEESPVVMLGMETPQADYAFIVQATELIAAGDTFDVAVDLEVGDFILNTSYNEEPSTYDFVVLRIDDDGEQIFGAADFVMQPDNTLYLNYLAWLTNGTFMLADLDIDNDGIIDETYELPDVTDEFADW